VCTFALQAILDDAGVSVLFTDAGYLGALGVERVLSMPGEYEDLIASADEADEVPLGDGGGRGYLAALGEQIDPRRVLCQKLSSSA